MSADDGTGQVWAIRLPDGRIVRLEDLPFSLWEAVLGQLPGDINWVHVLAWPTRYYQVIRPLWRAVLERNGFDIESVSYDDVTPDQLCFAEDAVYVLVDDDTPSEWRDGVPLDPTASSTPG